MTLRVDVGAATRFWLRDLAQELHLQDVLDHFFTCELALKKYVGNLPLTRVRSVPVTGSPGSDRRGERADS